MERVQPTAILFVHPEQDEIDFNFNSQLTEQAVILVPTNHVHTAPKFLCKRKSEPNWGGRGRTVNVAERSGEHLLARVFIQL